MKRVFYVKLLPAQRTMHVACNLRASCVPSSKCAMRLQLRGGAQRLLSFALTVIWMHACTIRKYFEPAKWENKPIPRLQFRAAHSLDFLPSQLHVFTTRAVPSKRRRHCKCVCLFATPALLECQRNILARFVWWPFKSLWDIFNQLQSSARSNI
jgi:hypothetical protein